MALLPRAGLLAASLLLVLVLGEVYARLVWQDPPRRPVRSYRASEEGMATFDGLFDLAQASQRGIYQGVLHETNDRGIRGRDRTPRPRPGVVRIGVGGDSFTMGWGVEEPDTYVARLERLLQQGAGEGVEFEALNFGLAGLNAVRGINRLVSFAEVYDVDVVVWGFTVNDIEGPHYVKTTSDDSERRRSIRSYRHRYSRWYLVRLVGPSAQSLYDRYFGEAHWRFRELEHNYLENPAAAKDFESAIDTFAELVATRRGCGLVLIHTSLAELGLLHPWKSIYEHVERLGEQRGLIVVETYSAFAGMNEPSLWVSQSDPHPNAEGHRILAELLREGLEELPAHCLVPDTRRAAGGARLP